MNVDQQLDQAINFSQDVLDIFTKKKELTERIKHRDHNAYIELDKSLVGLFDDIRTTLTTTKTLFDQTKQFGNIPNNYIKYFRLLQQNSKMLTDYLAKVLEDSRVSDTLGRLTTAGKSMVEMFVTVLNNVIDAVNKKIATPLFKIRKLKDIKFVTYADDIQDEVSTATEKQPNYEPEYQQWMNESIDNRVHSDEEVEIRLLHGKDIFNAFGYDIIISAPGTYFVRDSNGAIIADPVSGRTRFFSCAEEAYEYCITDTMLEDYITQI